MCGLAGSINKALNVEALTQDLYHRGPDEQTTHQVDSLLLHHHRLSIVDIACGHQPMHHGDLTIIFNGEIYNHAELRIKHQLQCKTASDTETLLHLYEKLGLGLMDELDGMFIFVIHDKKNDKLLLARDRAGKKPLYYFHDGKSFVFSSELRALRNQLPLEINTKNLQQFVRVGYFHLSNTPYQQVFELPAGSFVMVDIASCTLKVEKWWNIHEFYLKKSTDDFETALEKTDKLLHQAIKRRVMSSDLEVGSFLSGGIDSGLVTAIASEYNSSLKTFTVSFEGEYDEAPLAKLVAERYKTDHHEIKISFDSLVNDIEGILVNYGEPFFDSSAIPSYYVSKEAKKHLTVILNGDGGDEIFAGYRRYVPFASHDFFRNNALVKGMASLGHAILPAPANKKSKYNHMYRLFDLAAKKDLEVYLSATIDGFQGFEKYLVSDTNPLQSMEDEFSKINSSSLTGLKKLMNLDFDNILSNLLVKMDIATMAHSLEGRSPLLCKELLEYIPTLPDSYKIKNKQTKYLLRKLSEKYLPAELIHQPKRGFEIPLKNWVNTTLKEKIGAYILPKDAYCRNFLQAGFLDKLWNNEINVGEEKRAKMIWTLFALEVWYQRVYVDGAARASENLATSKQTIPTHQ